MMDMRAGFAVRPLHLNVGELLEVSDGKGLAVRCLEGCVWITKSDDQRDIVLGAGEGFVLDVPGVALVCAAATPAAFAIEAPQPLRAVPMGDGQCRRQSAGMLRGPVISGRAQAMNRYTLMTFITILAKTIRNRVR
jgi:hypothetical protein